MEDMASVKRRPVTDEEFDAAARRGFEERWLSATRVSYDASRSEVVVQLYSGVTVAVPRRFFPHIQHATAAELTNVELSPAGWLIVFPALDADYSVAGLLREIFGLTEQQRRAGATKSLARAAASRENGKKGGRPKTPR
ncbi:MAG TPA: DUF2442 domain-containing protein [Candidatus Elarobacter sp.]|nr:DUF2442 domain-containing protein [Candidatus Elarobacter sp.]